MLAYALGACAFGLVRSRGIDVANRMIRSKSKAGVSVPASSRPSAATYTSASAKSVALHAWNPAQMSADSAVIPDKRVTEARAWDLVRTNGYARGAIQNQQDRIVGACYRLQLMPAYRSLGLSSAESAKWASGIEQAFHSWANDPNCYIDAQRKRTFSQLLREAVATDILHGEVFIKREWRESPSGFSTCFSTISPDRIETPSSFTASFLSQDVRLPNGNRLRSGVELDHWGAAVAYHVRSAHPSETRMGTGQPVIWNRISVTNDFGWREMIHLFDLHGADQTRGMSAMASTLTKMKMMDVQEDLELQQTAMTPAFAMYVKSSMGLQRAKELFGDSDDAYADCLASALGTRSAFYGSDKVSINGVRIPALFPDDEIGTVQAHDQPANHEQFKDGLLGQVARSLGMSREELTGDFSKTSYSSARASMQMAWQYTLSKRANIVNKLASHIFRLWFDEGVVRGLIVPPDGVTYAPMASNAVMGRVGASLTQCNWIGAGRVVIDEFKQAKANEISVSTWQASVQDVLAESGTDTETMLDQAVSLRSQFEERGLPLPAFLGGPPAEAKSEVRKVAEDGEAFGSK